jgi:hypothetical protein
MNIISKYVLTLVIYYAITLLVARLVQLINSYIILDYIHLTTSPSDADYFICIEGTNPRNTRLN